MKKTPIDKDKLWQEFIIKDRIWESLDEALQNQIRPLNYKEAQKLLKTAIDRTIFGKLNGRFRAHMHRQKSGKSTLTVDSYILAKLDAMRATLGSDDYSDLLEYLLKPDGAYKQELQRFHAAYKENHSSSANLNKDFSQLFSTLYPQHQNLLKLVLEQVFLAGVSSGKQSRLKSTQFDDTLEIGRTLIDDLIHNLDNHES